MLDAQFIRDNLDAVKTNCQNRNVQADVDRVVQLGRRTPQVRADMQVVQQRQNEIAKLIPKEKDKDKKQALIQEGRELRKQVSGPGSPAQRCGKRSERLLRTIPNMTHPEAPVGSTRGGQQGHQDMGRAAQVRLQAEGSRRHGREPATWSISRPAPRWPGKSSTSSRTKPCCSNWPWSSMRFKLCSSPATRRSSRRTSPRVEVLEGIGFLPRGPETQIYSLENTDLCLIATAEITLGGMHRDQIFEELRPADQVRRHVALLPHRGRGAGPGHARSVPRASIHQGRDVRLHHAGSERGHPSGAARHRGERSSRGSACRTR